MTSYKAEVIIALVVLVVLIAGLFVIVPASSPTGMVSGCGCSGGDPVCAALDGRVLTFENSCLASCAGARVVRDGWCADIPRM